MTEIRPEWLLDLAPQYYDLSTFQDGETKRALARVIAKREGRPAARGDGAGGAEGKEKKRKSKDRR